MATADVHGQRDVAVLYGPACSLRILDDAHLAYPDAGLDPVTASRSNLAEAPDVALLMVAPDGHGGRLGLHVNGTARTVPARELRAEHPDLPVQPMPGRPTEVWVVVEVGDAYALDGDDVPPLIPPPAPAPAPASVPPPASAPPPAPAATSDGRRRGLVVFVLITLVAALVVAVGLSGRRGDGGGGPAVTAAPPVVDGGPSGPATLYGRVLDVTDPATVVVDVAGRPVTVGVVGLDAATVPPCAMSDSLSFARRTLRDQTVTLVPDPTLPAASRPRAYVVLGTQLSYTDAAIRAGWAPAAGAAQYQAVFDGEQRAAQSAGIGMWGPPCRR